MVEVRKLVRTAEDATKQMMLHEEPVVPKHVLVKIRRAKNRLYVINLEMLHLIVWW